MDKQKFIEGLRNPSNLKDNDLIALNQVVSEYPYFLGARVLLAKASKENNDVKAKKYISSAAVYATDRLLLKKFLSDHLFFIDQKDETAEDGSRKTGGSRISLDNLRSTEEKIEDRKNPRRQNRERIKSTSKHKGAVAPVHKENKNQLQPDSKEKVEKVPPTISEKAPEIDVKPASIQSNTNIDDLIEEIYADIENLKVSRAKFFELEDKIEEEDAVNAALEKAQATQEINITEKEVAADVEDTDFEDKKEKVDEVSEITVEKDSPTTIEDHESSGADVDPAEVEKKPAKKKTPVKKTSKTTAIKKETKSEKVAKPKARKKKSDTKDLEEQKVDSVEAEPTVEKEITVIKETEEKEAIQKEETPESSPKVEPVTAAPDDTLKVVRRKSGKVQSTTYEKISGLPDEKDKIIDEFISKRPSITPAKKTSPQDKKEDLADSSTRFQADIASEYLAEIYVEQGKIQRAILIYDQLGLKFPEKKSFFASRIKELKSKKDK